MGGLEPPHDRSAAPSGASDVRPCHAACRACRDDPRISGPRPMVGTTARGDLAGPAQHHGHRPLRDRLGTRPGRVAPDGRGGYAGAGRGGDSPCGLHPCGREEAGAPRGPLRGSRGLSGGRNGDEPAAGRRSAGGGWCLGAGRGSGGLPRGPNRGGQPRAVGRPAAEAVVSGWGTLVLRTLIPVACVLCVYGARSIAGPDKAGLLLPFPATSLSVLVATHLESGPGHACLMARAMPIGAFSTVAFLFTFRSLTQGFGPVGGTAFGYLAAACAFLVIEHFSAWEHNVNVRAARRSHPAIRRRVMMRRGDRLAAGLVWRHRRDVAQRPRSTRSALPARRAPFSPLVEALAG